MRNVILLSLVGLSLLSCQHTPKTEFPLGQHPLIGCWENETALERESWKYDPHALIIGYAESRDTKGNVTFSEFMYLNRSNEPEVLEVTGQDNSKTRFTRRKTDDAYEFRFENPDHDYPQVIMYTRSGDALNAYISLMDGTKRVNFDKKKCKIPFNKRKFNGN
ncbi:MAG: DUF6265 family protein [Hellea sp.]